MEKTHIIRVRTTEDQFQRIKNNAQAKGYKTISAYIRQISLEHDLVIDKMINEIYKEVVIKKDK